MIKIGVLHQYIISLGLVLVDDVDSYVDKLVVTPAGRPESNGNIVLADTTYTSTFYISGYPFNRHPVELLIGQLSTWLLEYDDTRKETAAFTVNVDVLDENGNVADVANLEFEIVFDEQLVITPDASGSFLFNNQSYSLA